MASKGGSCYRPWYILPDWLKRTVVPSLSLLWWPLALGLLSGILWTQRKCHYLFPYKLRSLSKTGDVYCLQKPSFPDGTPLSTADSQHAWFCRDPLSSDALRLEVAQLSLSLSFWKLITACPSQIPSQLDIPPFVSQVRGPWAQPAGLPPNPAHTWPSLSCALTRLHHTLFHLLPYGLGLTPHSHLLRSPPGSPLQPRTAVSHSSLLWHFTTVLCRHLCAWISWNLLIECVFLPLGTGPW